VGGTSQRLAPTFAAKSKKVKKARKAKAFRAFFLAPLNSPVALQGSFRSLSSDYISGPLQSDGGSTYKHFSQKKAKTMLKLTYKFMKLSHLTLKSLFLSLSLSLSLNPHLLCD